ncbi:S1 RNA-binding domain-containing protein, partial [bacterium]|nr:S1 RNA-binding domain-containing protein [bacterium]
MTKPKKSVSRKKTIKKEETAPKPKNVKVATPEPKEQLEIKEDVEPATKQYFYDDEEEYSEEEYAEMLQAYEETMRDIREGEIVKGKIIQVSETDALVDVGFKSEGIIPIIEFGEPLNVKVGDEFDVYLESIENQDGQLVLSKQKADFMRVWDNIKNAYDNGELVEGRLLR